jgi:hypothetical protein
MSSCFRRFAAPSIFRSRATSFRSAIDFCLSSARCITSPLTCVIPLPYRALNPTAPQNEKNDLMVMNEFTEVIV